MTGVRVRAPEAGARDVRRAWWSLALFPLSFLAAFAVGEGLATLLGLRDREHRGGAGVADAGRGRSRPARLRRTRPCWPAFFARRAEREGDRGGRVPMWIGVGLATAFVLLNVVQGVLVVLLD